MSRKAVRREGISSVVLVDKRSFNFSLVTVKGKIYFFVLVLVIVLMLILI